MRGGNFNCRPDTSSSGRSGYRFAKRNVDKYGVIDGVKDFAKGLAFLLWVTAVCLAVALGPFAVVAWSFRVLFS